MTEPPTPPPSHSTAFVVARSALLLAIVYLLPQLVSWRWNWWEAWLYTAINVGGFAISRLVVAQRHPDLLIERARSLEKKDAKPIDRLLVGLLVLTSTLALVVAGLEARGREGAYYSFAAKLGSVAVQALGMAFGTWAMAVNRFFAGFVRIQKDRGHVVVSAGPYAIVRHPGYVASMLVYIATPVLLDARWAWMPTALAIGVLVVRTRFEDQTLQRELEGYAEYTRRTRFRLVPGVW